MSRKKKTNSKKLAHCFIILLTNNAPLQKENNDKIVSTYQMSPYSIHFLSLSLSLFILSNLELCFSIGKENKSNKKKNAGCFAKKISLTCKWYGFEIH